MNQKIKQRVSAVIGVPAAIFAVLTANSEELAWLLAAVFSMSVVVALTVWNFWDNRKEAY